MSKTITIHGSIGMSGDREVFIGITSASILHSLSFADVLNEETGNGYQRRFNPRHSLDFRRYIQTPNSTTIPLTLNLRPSSIKSWKIKTHFNRGYWESEDANRYTRQRNPDSD